MHCIYIYIVFIAYKRITEQNEGCLNSFSVRPYKSMTCFRKRLAFKIITHLFFFFAYFLFRENFKNIHKTYLMCYITVAFLEGKILKKCMRRNLETPELILTLHHPRTGKCYIN